MSAPSSTPPVPAQLLARLKTTKPLSVFLQAVTANAKPSSEPDSKTSPKSLPPPESKEPLTLQNSTAMEKLPPDSVPPTVLQEPEHHPIPTLPRLNLELIDQKTIDDHPEPPAPKRRRRGRPPKNVWSTSGETSTAASAESEWRIVTFKAKKKPPKRKS